jgi:hypothetical protein
MEAARAAIHDGVMGEEAEADDVRDAWKAQLIDYRSALRTSRPSRTRSSRRTPSDDGPVLQDHVAAL